jgi:hypothetical protein
LFANKPRSAPTGEKHNATRECETRNPGSNNS